MKKIILFLCLWSNWGLCQSQTYTSTITNYGLEEGLSSNEIYALHKDARGFIWIGTRQGLNRFDGQEFKVYSPDNQAGMTLTRIDEIFEDEAGYLWLLKSSENYAHPYSFPQINLLNIYTGECILPEQRFGEEMPFAIEDIRFMNSLGEGQLFFFLKKQHKGYIYQADKGFQALPFPKEIIEINEFSRLEGGDFLFKGLVDIDAFEWLNYRMNPEGQILAQGNTDLKMSIREPGHTSSVQFAGHHYMNGGYNLEVYQHFSPNLDFSSGATNTAAESVDQSSWNEEQGLFWLKTKDRILVIQPDGSMVYERKEQFDHNNIPILFDGATTWLSNTRDGLMAIQLHPKHFQHYRCFPQDFDNSTRGIYRDSNANLWVSTIAGVTTFKDQNQTPVQNYRTNDFTRFREDDGANLWHIEKDKLVRHHLESGQKTSFPLPGYGFASWDILPYNDQEIWLQGINSTLLSIHPQTGTIKVKSVLPCEQGMDFLIYEFTKQDRDNIWLCTNQGLYLVDGFGQLKALYNSQQEGQFQLPCFAVHHFYEDDEGVKWLASGDAGLIRWAAHEEVPVRQFTMANGLSSNALHAIYEDDYGFLWISSDRGLMQFDKQSEKVTAYFVENGLPHNEFNRIAHFQDLDGRLYFGGLLGVTVFHPKHFAEAQKQITPAPLVITNYQQFSGEGEVFLDLTAAIQQDRSIVLQANDRFFNLKVALLNYQKGKQNEYQYRIKGIYDWQSNDDGKIGISGLAYGHHVLEIRAFDASRQVAANEISIDIQVLRPFYLQWWFIVLLTMAMGFGFYLLIKRRTRRLLLQQETQQLKELDQMKSHFFTNIAHELRTPLSLIGLPLEHLMSNWTQFSEPEIMEYLRSAHSNQQHLNRLVNEILNLSRLEAGKLEVQTKAVALPTLINRIVEVFQTNAELQDIDFNLKSTLPEQLVVEADAHKLEMVLNNLLSNALKFTPTSGKIMIRVDWTATSGFSCQVQDTGRGISEENLPNVFNRYFQARKEEDQLEGGSGIGLAICRELVELMGGAIAVESELGQGSTFSIKVPMQLSSELSMAPVPQALRSFQLQEAKEDLTPTSSKQKVLVVEDNPELRFHLKNILKKQYQVVTATNGLEGLALLEQCFMENDLPHLILSDVMMMEMDGLTFLKKLKADDRFCSIPFILLTARDSLQDKLKSLRIGVDAYMTKPFNVEELVLRVQNLISNAQGRNTWEVAEKPSPVIAIPPSNKTLKKKKTPVLATTPVAVQKEDLNWLQQVEDIAQREIKNPAYSIDDLARDLLMSRRQVFRKIKSITGLTPKKYLNSVRLQKAKIILETEQVLTLTEICYAVGFENTTHFANLFEAEFGLRPHDLLRKSAN